jgi:hypothetical protein
MNDADDMDYSELDDLFQEPLALTAALPSTVTRVPLVPEARESPTLSSSSDTPADESFKSEASTVEFGYRDPISMVMSAHPSASAPVPVVPHRQAPIPAPVTETHRMAPAARTVAGSSLLSEFAPSSITPSNLGSGPPVSAGSKRPRFGNGTFSLPSPFPRRARPLVAFLPSLPLPPPTPPASPPAVGAPPKVSLLDALQSPYTQFSLLFVAFALAVYAYIDVSATPLVLEYCGVFVVTALMLLALGVRVAIRFSLACMLAVAGVWFDANCWFLPLGDLRDSFEATYRGARGFYIISMCGGVFVGIQPHVYVSTSEKVLFTFCHTAVRLAGFILLAARIGHRRKVAELFVIDHLAFCIPALAITKIRHSYRTHKQAELEGMTSMDVAAMGPPEDTSLQLAEKSSIA